MLRRRDRMQRNRRIGAAAVAIAVFVSVVALAVGAFEPIDTVPIAPPTETGPTPLSPDITYPHNGDIAVFQEMHIVDGHAEPRVVAVDPERGRLTTLPIQGRRYRRFRSDDGAVVVA